MLLAVSKGLTVPLFAALRVQDTTVSFALHAPLSGDGVDSFTGEAVEPPKRLGRFRFGAAWCRSPDGEGVLRRVDQIEIDLARLSTIINPRRLGPCVNLYVAFDFRRGRFLPPYNKLAESFASKDDGARHIAGRQVNVVGQILLPFADAAPADCAARLTVNQTAGFWTSGEADILANSHQAYVDFAARVFPGLDIETSSLSVKPDERALIGVRLLAPDGAFLKRAGVRLFAKTAAGYLPRTEVRTDTSGRARIPFLALGLEPGDRADVELGFKWLSNIAACRVEVQS
ncbi:MAG: hypothetical protein HN377_01090 [Alphaproteobacteria bacterium]|jgi:hypothetical protein|nr:hypothetical protein [Alphaproteobacteria bacterium]MBT4085167.1 hypothetical protein [Alphaproteobacteria bacterium]MBT4543216.1 hypothetical protein [Alphaproteobacteria bacterium]MBT6242636.1 hypothetical protein [Rhodospirillaceae bacterium]